MSATFFTDICAHCLEPFTDEDEDEEVRLVGNRVTLRLGLRGLYHRACLDQIMRDEQEKTEVHES